MKKILLLLILSILLISSASAKEYIHYTQQVLAVNDGYNVEVKVSGVDSQSVEQFITKYPSNVIFLIDTSASMNEEYLGKTRLEWAMEKVKETITSFQKDTNVGLVGFSDQIFIIKDFTPASQISNMSITVPETKGNTHMFSGLQKGIELLENNPDPRPGYIILLTDGRNTEGKDPLEIAQNSAFPIYAVSIGKLEEVDGKLLGNIASSSGGAYIHVSEIDKLKTQIQELILKKKEISAQNLKLVYTQGKDLTIDVKSISITSGNIDTAIPPQVSHNILASTGGMEIIVPQMSQHDEILIKFNVIPTSKWIKNLGLISLTGLDAEKEINEQHEINANPVIELGYNIDYPDTVNYGETGKIELTLRNPTDTKLTAKSELQIISDNVNARDLVQTVDIDPNSEKIINWELESKEPTNGKVTLMVKISGNNVAEKVFPKKEIPIEDVYHRAKNASNSTILAIVGALLLIVGIVMFIKGKRDASNAEGRISRIKAENLSYLQKISKDVKNMRENPSDADSLIYELEQKTKNLEQKAKHK